MVLKLGVDVRNVISFFYIISPKPGDILIFGTFLAKFSIFAQHALLKIGYFEVRPYLWHHCDVINWMFVLVLVCMERGDPLLDMLWYRYQLDVGLSDGSLFKFSGDGNHPLGKLCRLGKTRVLGEIAPHVLSYFVLIWIERKEKKRKQKKTKENKTKQNKTKQNKTKQKNKNKNKQNKTKQKTKQTNKQTNKKFYYI